MLFLDLLIIFLVGLFASFFSTIVGGGALLKTPILIFLGLPAQTAVATDRISSLGFSSGLYKFMKEGKVNIKLGLSLLIFSMIGAFFGANLLLQMQENILRRIIAIITILILMLIIFKKNIGTKKIKTKITPIKRVFGHISIFFLGMYNAFFGGGAATFYSYVLILVFGQTFLESAGTRKILTLASAFIASIVYIISGIVNYAFFVTLFTATIIGSYLGSAYAIKKGEKWVRSLFIIIVLLMAVRLLFL